jgi:RNA polymerase sigma-70 factor, ECF subfamily
MLANERPQCNEMPTYSKDITQILLNWNPEDTEATDQLFSLIYDELHKSAKRIMRCERAGHTLQPTALVNEAYLRLIDQRRVSWQNRAHFFGMAAQLMRRILVKHAERRSAAKRGGGQYTLSLDEVVTGSRERSVDSVDLIALDHALTELTMIDPRQSHIVELRFFAGLNIEEIGGVLNLSPATVKREWRLAKAWLYGAIQQTQELCA